MFKAMVSLESMNIIRKKSSRTFLKYTLMKPGL